jgi:hypothetical protein
MPRLRPPCSESRSYREEATRERKFVTGRRVLCGHVQSIDVYVCVYSLTPSLHPRSQLPTQQDYVICTHTRQPPAPAPPLCYLLIRIITDVRVYDLGLVAESNPDVVARAPMGQGCPTPAPTKVPTERPSLRPTAEPSQRPTVAPTVNPTQR